MGKDARIEKGWLCKCSFMNPTGEDIKTDQHRLGKRRQVKAEYKAKKKLTAEN